MLKTPLAKKLLFVAAGAAVGALAAVPELAAYSDLLKALAGFLMGAGVIKRPGDTAGV